MGQKENEFALKLKQLLSGSNPVFIAEVKAVDMETNTCTIDYNGVDVEGVNLGAKGEKDKTIIVYPKVGKFAIFGRIGNSNQFFMIHCAEAEKISIESGTSLIEIQDGEILMNGGENKGLVLVEGLKAKLNAIESSITDLKSAFSSWIVVPYDGGLALKSIAASWAAQTLAQTALADIENTKVKH